MASIWLSIGCLCCYSHPSRWVAFLSTPRSKTVRTIVTCQGCIIDSITRAMNPSYPSNLTNEQWELLSELIPAAKPGGRKRSVEMQAVINAIFYILCAGCAWRLLPHDFPKWQSVYHYFRQWRIDGTWQKIHERLREWVRVSQNREPSPTEAIMDSQTVETATMVSKQVGFDSGKKIKGRKRHLLVDTLGLLMVVVI